jgi:imidazolonepropionase-like amidohydrolase
VVQGKLPVLVVANQKRAIRDAVQFCEKQKLKMILGGGSESYKVKDLLASKHIPVILGPTQSLPEDEDAPYDQSYATPGQLQAAGIKIAFASFNDASFARRLPYQAANAVAYGLPYDEALKAITLYPAQMLGLADQLGTVEPGKVADLIVTDGDPLAIPTQVRYLFINGQLTSTENRHSRLYEQYRKRSRP